MRALRIIVAWFVMAGVSTSVFAGDLRASAVSAAQEQTRDKPMPKPYLWAGSGLFVGGMAVGIYAFLHNRNGQFPEFNEATATNKPLGAAGLGAAFAGGTILFLGKRKANESITVAPGKVTVSKRVTW